MLIEQENSLALSVCYASQLGCSLHPENRPPYTVLLSVYIQLDVEAGFNPFSKNTVPFGGPSVGQNHDSKCTEGDRARRDTEGEEEDDAVPVQLDEVHGNATFDESIY
uniref:Uncharacterized protein n=1 Tax=Oryza nivara TaxID=4536 RepID=A0A0E0FHG6_ORYNI